MSRCELSGLSPVVENLVSHSNIKTKTRAFPNIQNKRFYSSILKKTFKVKVATRVIKTIDKLGSVDTYILKQEDRKLSPKMLQLKGQILKRIKSEIKN